MTKRNVTRKLIYLSAVFCLFSCANEQNKHAEATSSSADTARKLTKVESKSFEVPKSIAAIKQVYAATIGDLTNGKLDSIAYKYNCQGERSGTITYFSKNGKLLVIKHQYNEYDHFEATDQYFLNEKELYFIHLNRLTWSFDSSVGKDGATKDDIVEQRMYIVEGKPIQCLEKKFTIRSHANNNPKPENNPNRIIACKPLKPLLNEFQKLLDFQDSKEKDCLDK